MNESTKQKKRFAIIAMAVFALLILSLLAYQFFYSETWQQKTWSTPRKIAGYANNAYSPKIFTTHYANAKPFAIAVWKEFDEANQTYSIWASLYNQKHNSWKISQALSTQDLAEVSAPQIAGNQTGDVIVVWVQTDRQNGLQQVWSSRYNANTALWSKVEAASASTTKIEQLQIALDNNASAMAIWQQTSDGEPSVWQNRFDPKQQRWQQAQQISSRSSSPRLSMHADGNAAISWQSIEQNQRANKINSIWVSIYQNTQQHWQTAQKISDGLRSSKQANLAVGNDGQVIVAWNQESLADANGKTSQSVWVNRYRPQKGWDSIKKISSDSAVLLEPPQLAIDQQGNAMVAWQQNEAIWINRFVANQTWELAQLLSGNAEGVQAYTPHLAVAQNGDATLSWIQDNKPHNALFASVYSEKLKWSAPQQISEGSEDIVMSHLSINQRLESLLIWQQNDGEQDSIAVSVYR